ncbi:UDP-N-acetylenolpyruvoylglucosamine reductase [Paenibacillus antibioticophila]|uniref:UDP-N-acetylenolpyruvoylglucosamine reductase n=1 Tax=Paenibacillus antibioticophila TaxID=1274374 RepID=A0A920CJQ4_9BACL|nr:UDP-N-acetylmuramate dehydrogenase [Paenibacillus antibioticophila]GIO39162.1 UDP-N-acetylenolpyruvoylglucosamine reductase [Paenibacillus antibioticophila]
MQQWISKLSEQEVGAILPNEPMSRYTTWKIGGPADAMVVPDTKAQLLSLIRQLREEQIPWMTIGKGSNMLVSDKGIRGVVIRLGKGFEDIRFGGSEVTAGGGASFVRLSVMAGKQGLTGLEFAAGVPGTVGGAVYMNAGAHGSDVSRIFKSADIVLETGELVTYTSEDMDFRYRHSLLHDQRGIVAEARFVLSEGDRLEIAAAMATYKDRRRKTQPLQQPCAGSVFRNPPGDYAARLIESAGLKGRSVGGAEVSALHANFIVNTGQATAENVLELMEIIKATILSEYDIALVPEVFFVGER